MTDTDTDLAIAAPPSRDARGSGRVTDTTRKTISALSAAICSNIRIRALRGRPLPLLADTLTWCELDSLVSWGSRPTAVDTIVVDVGGGR